MSAPPAAAAASAAATRCARPDCISLREELELLRGDLQEIESENEQLHDKLAQVENESQRAKHEHQREQTAAQSALTHKHEELERIEHVVLELRAALQHEAKTQLQANDRTAAVTDSNAATDAVDTPQRIAQLEQQNDALRGANAALEAAVAELRAASAREVAASAAAQHAVAQLTQASVDKRSELYRVLKENEVLRIETRELEDALRRTTDAALENEAAATALLAQQQAFRDAIDEQTIEITQLHAKLEAIEAEKRALEQQLVAMDERESDVDALLRDARTQHERERSVLRHECDALRQHVQTLEQQTQKLKQAGTTATNSIGGSMTATETVNNATDTLAADTVEMEQQLELLQELRVRDRATIAELEQRVQQQQSDLESLTEHLDAPDATAAAVTLAVQRAVSAEHAANAQLRTDHASLTQRVREQRDVVQQLELRQAQLERALVDAHEWTAKYERGAGLEDVVKFQRELRRKLETQQRANAALRQELNAQIDATGRRDAAFKRLKAECGKPAAFEYDDLVLEHVRRGEVAELQAVVAQLEQQLMELEAERVRLLQKLRDQARATGHRLFDAHGVTPEQWRLVEQFIERVKLTPEVAARLLSTGGVGGAAVPDIDGSSASGADSAALVSSSSAAAAVTTDPSVFIRTRDDRDAVAMKQQYETKIAHAHAANQQLADTVARLRAELAQAQRQVQTADAQSGVIGSGDGVGKSNSKGEDLRDIREQIQRIVQEQAAQRSERDVAAVDPPTQRDVKATADADADVESLSSVSADEREDNDDDATRRAQSTQTTATAAAAPLLRAADGREPPPRALGDDDGNVHVTRTGRPRGDWDSVESIAAAVATALESKLALLQRSGTSSHQQQQMTTTAASSPESEVPHSTAAAATIADSGSITATPRAAAVATTVSPSPSVDALAFESEQQLAAQLDVLQELNVCLDELVRSEAQNEALTQQLAKHELTFRSVADQHTLLYQHMFELHDASARNDAQLRRQVAERTHAHRELQLKCERYEATLHVLASTSREASTNEFGIGANTNTNAVDIETQLRAHVVELTRKTAAYEVNDAVYRRKYQHLHGELAAAQARARTLEHDSLEMERTLTCRITYLEHWKSGADALVERLERTLANSVLQPDAERQERAATQLLRKHHALSEAFAELQVKWLQLHDVPQQLSRVQHENALLRAEQRASGRDAAVTASSSSASIGVDPLLQTRIAQLEHELAVQTQRVRAMEEAQAAELTAEVSDATAAGESDLAKENALLCERISEVEQLYESLARECAKSKDVAALAARQANTLATRAAQDAARRDDMAAHVRELAAASEDHAVVGELQQQVQTLKRSYQQFLLKYDALASDQQQHAVRAQQLELELERRSTELHDERERARHRIAVLETTLSEVAQRDLSVRNAKWDAFRKRLDALDDALRAEQERRRALEHELETQQLQLPRLARSGNSSDSPSTLDVSRLKARVEALETRERALMAQLERSTTSAAGLEQLEMLQAELTDTKALNSDVLQQLQAAQTRITALITQHSELERRCRELAHVKEDVELELQHAHAQLELLGNGPNNQRDVDGGNGSHSPLMRKKVGLYEQDQAALQQAAQATIASLKQLVADKNAVVAAYERKLQDAQLAAAQLKSHDRVATAQLHKTLFDDNQRMIAQLQDAAAKIRVLERSGSDKRALAAAQERHDAALREWQQCQVALEAAQQTIRERDAACDVLANERDVAEARAGEALEEIVLLRERVTDQQRASQQVAHQLAAAKRDVSAKSDKMKLLRDAVIQLKEEFLKAEDRHAIEVAKAQAAAAAATAAAAAHRKRQASKREDKNDDDDASDDDAKHKAARLERQVQMLQEKLALATRATQRKRLGASKATPSDSRTNSKREVVGGGRTADDDDTVATAAAKTKALEDEVERLKRIVKDRVVGEARAVEALEKKLRVLEAQNLALREASVSTVTSAAGATGVSGVGAGRSDGTAATAAVDSSNEPPQSARMRTREHWATEKKLQRRNDALTRQLKDQHAELVRAQTDNAQLTQRLRSALEELTQLKRSRRSGDGDHTSNELAAAAAHNEDLVRQNQLLQDTLVLKRREWADAFDAQTSKYERMLLRLRQRLAQYSNAAPLNESYDDDDDDDDAHESASGPNRSRAAQLQREEQRWRATQDVRDELQALSDDVCDQKRALLDKDTQLLTLTLELESARLEIARLQRQTSDQTSPRASGQPSSSSRTIRPSRVVTTAQRSPVPNEQQALETVIETMKRVIAKLRRENEQLTQRVVATPNTLKRLQQQNAALRRDKEQRAQATEQLERDIAALRADKLQLQHRLRAAMASTTPTDTSNPSRPSRDVDDQVQMLELQLQRKNERLAQLETACDALERAAAQRELRLHEFESELARYRRGGDDHGRVATDRNRDDDINDNVVQALETHVRALETENRKLQHELAAFDADFFDEIEDLKYQFATAVRDKQRLEQQLRALTAS